MAYLLPHPKMQFFDSNGDPLVGGKVTTYEAGTSTPKATYTDKSEATPNANPVILNSRGEADIWWSTGGGYKIVLTDSDDSAVYSVDNVVGPFDSIETQQAIADNDTIAVTGLVQASASYIEFTFKAVALRGSARQTNRVQCLFTAGAWDLSSSQVGDCGMSYSIHATTGQVSYTSTSLSTGKLKWSILDKTRIES